MTMQIKIATRREFKSKDLWEMHTLRAKVFSGRLGWEVPVLSGMEIDGYDALEPGYMLMREPGGVLRGCWRLLPTEGPYMLKDSFPQLLEGREAPSDPHIWELSRFAIETDADSRYGFSEMTLESFEAIVRYGIETGLTHYVTVTTTAMERLTRRAGVVLSRIGAPQVIGVETAVALTIDVQATWDALFAKRLVA
ncbi:acyl-homoserine-lactone synthase [Telluria aromaticivorans]|uniref:Acyl-homoserine-lactone synthase n=1 Tax=Telluria aromaticivorans TaxID=2725995 RepID=A0A7Y2JVN8_9BURK|nr:acyl-homoserine-lactone synthase [Telluria aromaticivorans]NNG21901.1 acyl-homoserine-lactone synthase [Telluria aromaticivorans]